jgi:hypothetical protein
MVRPPVQQSSSIGEPAADRVEALEEALRFRRTTRRFSTRPLANRDQDKEDWSNPLKSSHGVFPPQYDPAVLNLTGLRKRFRRG